MSEYSPDFFRLHAAGSRQSALAVLPLVRELIGPVESVLDIGCGVGTWLAVWKELGVQRVTGVDGEYVGREQLQIPPGDFLTADLSEPTAVVTTAHDLTMSLEVAEHLPSERDRQFVELLSRNSDVILFSAAIPLQGGEGHVNEQWPSYWHERFEALGFQAFDLLRPRLWSDKTVEWWYRQNTILYARGGRADRLCGFERSSMPFDVVHPDAWTYTLTSQPTLTLRQLLKLMPDATRAAVNYRR